MIPDIPPPVAFHHHSVPAYVHFWFGRTPHHDEHPSFPKDRRPHSPPQNSFSKSSPPIDRMGPECPRTYPASLFLLPCYPVPPALRTTLRHTFFSLPGKDRSALTPARQGVPDYGSPFPPVAQPNASRCNEVLKSDLFLAMVLSVFEI